MASPAAIARAYWAQPGARQLMLTAAARGRGKVLVKAAGLPLYRRHVDPALELKATGERRELVIDALQYEFGGRA